MSTSPANALLPDDAKLIRSYDTSAASIARRTFEATGQRTSPYRAYPEREEYEDVQVYQLSDGALIERFRSRSRWGNIWSEPGPWEIRSVKQ